MAKRRLIVFKLQRHTSEVTLIDGGEGLIEVSPEVRWESWMGPVHFPRLQCPEILLRNKLLSAWVTLFDGRRVPRTSIVSVGPLDAKPPHATERYLVTYGFRDRVKSVEPITEEYVGGGQ